MPTSVAAAPWHTALPRELIVLTLSFLHHRQLRRVASLARFYNDAIQGSALWEAVYGRGWAAVSGSSSSSDSSLVPRPEDLSGFDSPGHFFRACVDLLPPVPLPRRIDEVSEDARTCLSDPYHQVRVSSDGLSATYCGRLPIGEGDRCVRADAPFPRQRHRPFAATYPTEAANVVVFAAESYFEVTIDDAGKAGQSGQRDIRSPTVAVGLVCRRFELTGRQPGWSRHTFGWHGDDGNRYHGSGRGRSFGEPFGPGDTIGCGLAYASDDTMHVFFTRNAAFVGVAFVKPVTARDLAFFPCVGLDAPWRVTFNFGSTPTKPFVFPFTTRVPGNVLQLPSVPLPLALQRARQARSALLRSRREKRARLRAEDGEDEAEAEDEAKAEADWDALDPASESDDADEDDDRRRMLALAASQVFSRMMSTQPELASILTGRAGAVEEDVLEEQRQAVVQLIMRRLSRITMEEAEEAEAEEEEEEGEDEDEDVSSEGEEEEI